MTKTLLQILFASLGAYMLCGCAAFKIESDPSGAEVWREGRHVGSTPHTCYLYSGKQTYTLKKDGYLAEEVALDANDPGLVRQPMTPAESTVRTIPSGADVIRNIDGKETVVGTTPHTVPLDGPDTVTLRLENYYDLKLPLKPGYDEKEYLKKAVSTIQLRTVPAGVQVHDVVADKLLGVTEERDGEGATASAPVPVVIDDTSSLRSRSLVLTKPGYLARSTRLTLDSAVNTTIRMKRGNPTITSTPSGAAVYALGKAEEMGITPLALRLDGERTFEIRKDGYFPRTIGVGPEGTRVVHVELEKKPRVTLFAQPLGAKVYRKGGIELVGESPLTQVLDKEMELEIHSEGHYPKTIEIGPQSPQVVKVKLDEIPAVDISSDPEHCEVYLLGEAQRVGQTPIEGFQIRRDITTLEFHCEGYKPKVVALSPDFAEEDVHVVLEAREGIIMEQQADLEERIW